MGLAQGRLSHISAAHGRRSGRQQQKHAGGASAVPNRRGEDEAQITGGYLTREGPGEEAAWAAEASKGAPPKGH